MLSAAERTVMIDDRLPNAGVARVDTRKLGDYLLNPAHPDNGGKAAFFLALGFTQSDVPTLRTALVRLAAEGTLARRIVSVHGTKFVVDGVLRSPSDSEAVVRTVWIVDTGGSTPRLVTAYPREGK